MDLSEAYNNKTIYLEPRLQEYVRRKRFNRENNITPDIPEEHEFRITKNDRRTIKRHREGKTEIYNNESFDETHFVKANKHFEFEDYDFKNDPRFKRLQKKMGRDRSAKEARSNYDMMDNDCYVSFSRTNPYDLEENRPQKISKPYETQDEHSEKYRNNSEEMYDKQYDNFMMMNSKDIMMNKNDYYNVNRKGRDKSSVYHHTPTISYRNHLTPQKVNGGLKHKHDTTEIFNELDDYNSKLQKSYSYLGDDNRVNHKSSRGRNFSTRRNVPFKYGNGFADVSVEDSMRGRFRDSSKRSSGFRNSFEHNFNYISQNIQEPNHVVESRPQNTRGANKEVARNNVDSVYNGRM
jgi:hypothetical protein